MQQTSSRLAPNARPYFVVLRALLRAGLSVCVKPFHNMVVAAAMLYGTPEKKAVANHLLKKLATADAQVSGKNAADLTANLVAKLASTAVQDAKKELKGTYAKPNSPRPVETEADRGALDIFVSTILLSHRRSKA